MTTDLDPAQVAEMLKGALARALTPAVPDSAEDLMGRIVRLQRSELERVKAENVSLRSALADTSRRLDEYRDDAAGCECSCHGGHCASC